MFDVLVCFIIGIICGRIISANIYWLYKKSRHRHSARSLATTPDGREITWDKGAPITVLYPAIYGECLQAYLEDAVESLNSAVGFQLFKVKVTTDIYEWMALFSKAEYAGTDCSPCTALIISDLNKVKATQCQFWGNKKEGLVSSCLITLNAVLIERCGLVRNPLNKKDKPEVYAWYLKDTESCTPAKVKKLVDCLRHELGHAAGLAHSCNKKSIMHPVTQKCHQELTQEDIKALKAKFVQS